ncbi:hypothetical protein BGZ65_008480, partial [Modicella reniformis]
MSRSSGEGVPRKPLLKLDMEGGLAQFENLQRQESTIAQTGALLSAGNSSTTAAAHSSIVLAKQGVNPQAVFSRVLFPVSSNNNKTAFTSTFTATATATATAGATAGAGAGVAKSTTISGGDSKPPA